MRILIAGGTAISRRALMIFLQTKSDYQLVAVVSDMQDFEAQLSANHPDLIVLDSEPAVESLSSLIQSLQMFDPRPALILLTGQPELKQPSQPAGVDAFVSKVDPPKSLVTAIEVVRLRRSHG